MAEANTKRKIFPMLLTLKGGRKLMLETLEQASSYRGLMMGVPYKELNDKFIRYATDRAKLDGGHAPVHVLEPVRRPYHLVPGDEAKYLGKPHIREVPEWLPPVRCIAELISYQPAKDKTQDMSMLKLVWFQNEIAPPIEDFIIEQIAELDWDHLASDGNW